MGIELSKLCTANWLRREKKTVLLRKGVPFGELFQSAEFPPTTELTPDAESFCSRRFVFSACHATTCDESLRRENSLSDSRERRPAPLRPLPAPKLSRSLVNRANRVNSLVQFGPLKQPFSKSVPLSATPAQLNDCLCRPLLTAIDRWYVCLSPFCPLRPSVQS